VSIGSKLAVAVPFTADCKQFYSCGIAFNIGCANSYIC